MPVYGLRFRVIRAATGSLLSEHATRQMAERMVRRLVGMSHGRLTAAAFEIVDTRRSRNPLPGARLYEAFRGRAPTRRAKTGVRFGTRWITQPGRLNLLIPESIAVVGHVAAIEYDTTRDGRTVTARHTFHEGARPLLGAGARPGELLLIGTRYRFTDRGIIDLRPDGSDYPDGLDR